MKRLLLLATALTALLATTACGSDDGSATAVSDDDDAGSTEQAEPVTVQHRWGSTTLPAAPERIVSLDTQWTDVLVALDAPLVAAVLDPVAGDGRFPWQEDAIPSSVEPITATDAIPYEAVAAQRPDLIVITYFASDEATYDRLSEIAPTIPLLGDEEVDPWQDVATTAGTILGVPDEAEALIAEVQEHAAEVAAELPDLEGATYALANYVPGDAIYVVADPDDGSSRLFGELGMEIDPELLALADGATGRMELSLERTDELDADLLIMVTNGADTADIPGYDQLPAVQSGAVAILEIEDVAALNTPTPLSIPYALDLIRPALEAAAS